MALFDFGRKIDIKKEYSLEDIPIFSSLTAAEQRIIEKKGRVAQYRRGDIVYREDTPAEAFYVVVSGRFRLFVKSRPNEDETLLYFYRGDHFGEASLLTERQHSASVEAKSDGLILKLDKDDFFKVLKEIPSISLHLNRTFGHRLTRSEGQEQRREVKIAALFSQCEPQSTGQLWLDFASALSKEIKREVIIVDFVLGNLATIKEEFKKGEIPSYSLGTSDPVRPSELKSCTLKHSSGYSYLHVNADDIDSDDDRPIPALLTFLTYRYDYLMIRLPKRMNHVSFKSLKQSDVVYVYCDSDPGRLTECSKSIEEFRQAFGFSKIEIKVLIPSEKIYDEQVYEQHEKLLGSKIFNLLPEKNAQRYDDVLRFLAKEWGEELVGLALGSGAAYGLAHIGVLRVLERENIPIDVVSGSSMGALVGALWAAGYSSDQLYDFAHSIDKKSGFFKLIGFRDISIAHKGFFKGNQISRFLKSYVGNKTFQDLRIPVKIIGTNLFTSEPVVFEAGQIVDAIRASISIPGIFRPMLHKGQYLMDGGVIDPLPVKVLTQMGVKKIIAVNVLLGPQDRVERNRMQAELRKQEEEKLKINSYWSKFSKKFFGRMRDKYAINIFNVIMNTIQFMEYEIADAWGTKADILIHPVVYEGHWAQFYEPEKFIKAGEEKTQEQLAEIKRLLTEK